ncbi:GPALPP motifs-containing protein 1 isoform X2 [Canis lupus baileyi]|uniref:GPALPP motifs-containing protein 1 isoform X2 n=1 Tax=Canis lupus familiaris TaxID=9615 RepID=UPI0003AE7F21|nr:GPALPP motifs-containing protein 1 isoform X2 [Canis lupus familiaris]XP_013961896.1 GPALPP motifs-containing protein 1 isoform X2 [Canis lupus familiaris]XP_025334023.1 GPALPP motifs-containing protein 1 isoform X2 [Canis lupus dingo]XP_025334024.1 GPALPP motifs-containing protein 1 isoform X2 [Canis lupus dingo]XP_038425515.1 GPALPP motifs-containing protein 1 isoform X2 [Canis lupus familiaris]XP_038425516.1 GPALPP motifs-containing protein 1 isoform X2 [Canis lupus familiaris]|eukprot:XP_005633963.1 GPALPP motifs-containing protein 1 isoform X2 [Canis lupus familiaris]
MKTVVHCTKKKIRNLKKMTLVQRQENRGEIKMMMMMMMMMMKGFLDQLFLLDLKSRMILLQGPALPPGFIKSTQKSDKGRDDPGQQVSSYFNSEETDSSEDEDIVGPMPAKGPVNYSVTTEFEKRAQRMKEKLTKGDHDSSKPITRESWMTELPPEMKDFGLGPRTFKRRADDKSGDRSVWTDTPADREKKAKETQEARKSFNKKDEEHVLSGREKRLAEQVSSYNESKRSESLMDIHHKKLKNKAAEEKNKPQERIPFDRDKDLKVNRFDEAQKKALIKKSRELNTRFSHGKGSMFL